MATDYEGPLVAFNALAKWMSEEGPNLPEPIQKAISVVCIYAVEHATADLWADLERMV